MKYYSVHVGHEYCWYTCIYIIFLKVIRSEVKVANALVQHNIPLAFSDHLSPLLRSAFPDSEIAKSYASASTKTTCMINGAIAPYFKAALIEMMKNNAYSLATDGSNDTGIEKMNPMTVRLYDASKGRIITRFLDMCTTTGIFYSCSMQQDVV